MKIEQIKEKLQTKEYDFLKTNEHLGNNIILLTIGGSHAYGTDVETSDIDVRGIALERESELIGLSNFEQFENHETDTTIYSFRKIIQLLLNCNPNVIEILGTKNEHIFTLTEEGKLLRDNIDLFLSKKCTQSFGGYATAQLKRLENALARDSYPQSEKEKHIMGSIKAMMAHLKEHYSDYTKSGKLEVYLDDSEKEDYDQEIFMNIELNHYPLRDFKDIYSEMNEVTKQYGKLNYRNRKKTDGALLKHGMHLIRLLDMGIEILEGKGVHTYRPNREFLLDIRNGKYSYEEIFEFANERDKRFKYASDNTELPSKAKYKEIEELVININRRKINV
jgi:predicted nucleotidyltransferase